MTHLVHSPRSESVPASERRRFPSFPDAPLEAHTGTSCPLPGAGVFRKPRKRAVGMSAFLLPQEDVLGAPVIAAYVVVLFWGISLGLLTGWLIF